MRRIVFLDFDGVIATQQSYLRATARRGRRPTGDESFEVLDESLIANVAQLCDETGAKIVLSTAWREFYPFPLIVDQLGQRGLRAEIIGKTPVWPFDRPRKMSQYPPRNCRSIEIAKWVEEHGRATEFVILDDDRITIFEDRWVPSVFDDDEGTQPSGFTRAHLERALSIFGVSQAQKQAG